MVTRSKTNISEQDLDALLLQGQSAPLPNPEDLSEQDLDALLLSGQEQEAAPKQEQPIDDENAFLKGITAVGRFLDSTSGAPSRASFGVLQKDAGILPDPTGALDERLRAEGFQVEGESGRNALEASGRSALTFGQHFLDDPMKAPSGRELAIEAGASEIPASQQVPQIFGTQEQIEAEREAAPIPATSAAGMFFPEEVAPTRFETGGIADISPAGAAGLGLDIALDPTVLIPFNALGKLIKAGTKTTAKIAIKGSANAVDLATGLKTAETVESLSKTADNLISAVKTRFKPQLAKDFGEMSEIATRNGIDLDVLPEAIEFGREGVVSRASRHLAEGPLGEQKLKQFIEARRQVDSAVDGAIETISPTRFLDREEAGRHLIDSYDNGIDRFFKQMDFTYKSAGQQVPGMVLTDNSLKKMNLKLNSIERNAKQMISTGLSKTRKSQGTQLLETIDKIKNAKSYKKSVEQLQELGNIAFKKTPTALTDIPPDVKEMQKMYFAMRDAITDTVRTNLGDDIANRLTENNKAITELFSKNSALSSTLNKKNISPEAVFKNLVDSGDSVKIDALKSILSKEELQPLKAAYIEGLLKRNKEGEILYGETLKAINNDKKVKVIINSLFDNAEELENFKDILRLGDRMGAPVLSFSGTGASNSFSKFFQDIKASITDEVALDRLKSRARKSQAASKPSVRRQVVKGAKQAAEAIETEEQISTVRQKAFRAVRKGSQVKGAQDTSKRKQDRR